jgi:hypothetical protein
MTSIEGLYSERLHYKNNLALLKLGSSIEETKLRPELGHQAIESYNSENTRDGMAFQPPTIHRRKMTKCTWVDISNPLEPLNMIANFSSLV